MVNKGYRTDVEGRRTCVKPRTRWKDKVRKYMGEKESEWEVGCGGDSREEGRGGEPSAVATNGDLDMMVHSS